VHYEQFSAGLQLLAHLPPESEPAKQIEDSAIIMLYNTIPHVRTHTFRHLNVSYFPESSPSRPPSAQNTHFVRLTAVATTSSIPT
jgi:hypothetical protein